MAAPGGIVDGAGTRSGRFGQGVSASVGEAAREAGAGCPAREAVAEAPPRRHAGTAETLAEAATMKLLYSPLSPFARKARVVALEVGLGSRVELVPASVQPLMRNEAVGGANPLAQVPTLLLDDGAALYDSRVICEALDSIGGGALFPPAGPARWRALVEQALGDGAMGAALLVRYETALRGEGERSDAWVRGQLGKVEAALDRMEEWAPGLAGRVDIGAITLGCALGYLDFRFADLDWRRRQPALAAWFEGFDARPAMRGSRPEAV